MSYLPSVTALRCLDASARLGSFTRAANQLHLTQSAVSHHIITLERQLGAKLFERESGRLELTKVGRMYWEETYPALERLQRATRQIQLRNGHASLTVSVPPSFTHAWLMRRVSEDFVVNNPDITLNLVNRVGGSNACYDDMDAAIELSEGEAPGIMAVRLLSLVYSLYASPKLLRQLGLDGAFNHGTCPDAALVRVLQSAALIRTSMTDAWQGWLRVTKLDKCLDPVRLADGPLYAQASLALIAVLNGTGVALLPRHVAIDHYESGSLVRLSERGWPASRAYHLQWPVSRPVSPSLRRFAEWAVTIAESESG